ncbi:similar to Saccharomyces cerevisiae YGR006W PRP18 Splicing factor involved in the positioning of the 3' splice site during the second catalytic step of splicing [Maudiozyma saulgeensis]|uniref:Pre-mRNA-splicing factor 18 n=1 Tax=Maudiozyma saulgeensis TaxID=1789683 RepID=A0A1X7RA47_9SACH|nr:similar to Saccharomyces cerevisiae YGR006W PRP18 Splicing factor involved in the positioning of the 3' splice site during the second catalytic step of splicing [Kazachstania saulgeensis]
MSMGLSELIKREIEKKRKEAVATKEKVQEEEEDLGGKDEKPSKETNLSQIKDDIPIDPSEDLDTTKKRYNDDESLLDIRAKKIAKIISEEKKTPMQVNILIEDIQNLDNETIRKKVSTQCNRYIHQILTQWSKHVKAYQDGESMFVDTKKNLFPLLVLLRKNTLPIKLLTTLSSLLYHLQRDTKIDMESSLQLYLKLSIGDVAWPIGVSDVGIHSRSAQQKISRFGNNDVANIMIDETTRLWIISIKRLISFKSWLLKQKS